MTEKIPPPGHPDAVKQGCKCPVLDNAHGAGRRGPNSKIKEWWITATCPRHGINRPLGVTWG